MFQVKLFIVKVLKRLKLLSKFNFSLRRNYNGSIIIVPFKDGVGLPNYIIRENFLDCLIEAFAINGVFVDVGVNIGQSLIKLKANKPEIDYIGFEPNSTCVSYTQYLINLNSFKQCKVYCCALSNKVQTLELNKTLDADLRASLVGNLRPNYFLYKENVLALDFDTFFKNQNISFVKIDVEGAELDVLQGMEKSIRKNNPIITCEVLDSHSDEAFEFTIRRASRLYDLLDSLNYGVINLHSGSSGILDYKVVESFHIKQWTPESSGWNDYLFYPRKEEDEVINKLNLLIGK